jgi:lysozyme
LYRRYVANSAGDPKAEATTAPESTTVESTTVGAAATAVSESVTPASTSVVAETTAAVVQSVVVQQSAQRMLPGVDVASYQGPPGSWVPVAGDIKWAAVKLTEFQPGGLQYVNPDALADWNYLGAHNLGRIGYMFGHPGAGVTESVDLFTHELRSLGLRDTDMVALDLEVTDGLGPAAVDAWAASVCANLHDRLHRLPVLYTFLSFAEAGNTASLGKYPLWIADPSSPAGSPHVPAPWTTWAIHQYDISGSIDRDDANYLTLPGMQKALGKVEGAGVKNIGGSIAGGTSTVRWESGITVVAGLGTNGYIQTTRFHPTDGTWGPWRDVSPEPAIGLAGIVAWAQNAGKLYYTDQSHQVIQLTTNDAGATWT